MDLEVNGFRITAVICGRAPACVPNRAMVQIARSRGFASFRVEPYCLDHFLVYQDPGLRGPSPSRLSELGSLNQVEEKSLDLRFDITHHFYANETNFSLAS